MEYKGYKAAMIEIDEDSLSIHGRIELVRGMVTFEAETVTGAIQAFRDSIDDYLSMCAEEGIEPERDQDQPSEPRARPVSA